MYLVLSLLLCDQHPITFVYSTLWAALVQDVRDPSLLLIPHTVPLEETLKVVLLLSLPLSDQQQTNSVTSTVWAAQVHIVRLPSLLFLILQLNYFWCTHSVSHLGTNALRFFICLILFCELAQNNPLRTTHTPFSNPFKRSILKRSRSVSPAHRRLFPIFLEILSRNLRSNILPSVIPDFDDVMTGSKYIKIDPDSCIPLNRVRVLV